MDTRLEPEDGFDFATWLRTGRIICSDERWGAREVKFNPHHDPKDGRFTSGPGGGGRGRQTQAGGRSAPRRDGRTWAGPGFGGGGGGSFGGAGASGDGYWLNDAEVRSFRESHPGSEPHMVGPGETLDQIAVSHHTTSDRLGKLNGLPPGAVIKPGQVLALPGTTMPKADALQHVTKNGYGFGIDSSGRTHEAGGDLYLASVPERSRSSQQQAGGADRRATDDGGHFIAARFGGPGDSFNHFAQDANFNRGRYRAMEDGWAKDLRAGKRVSVDILVHYSGASRRPTELDVIWSTNGQEQSQKFVNERGGRKHVR